MIHPTRTTSMCLTPLSTGNRPCAASPTCHLTEKDGCPVVRAPRYAFYEPPSARFAICHLSHARVWEYNIPQWHAITRHVAGGVGLKSQNGDPPRPA
jgi:hypothetical protein